MLAIPQAALALVVALLAPPVADKITKESIESRGQTRAYYLYVPPSAGAAPAPLLVLLHGSGRRGDSLAQPWKNLAKKEGIVLVAPDSRDPAGWKIVEDGPDFLHDVVEAVKKSQRIDPRRVYLFGHSAGAVLALDVGLLESRYFAAVSLHAGAFRQPDEFRMIDAARRKIPFAVWLGTNDPFFSLAAARATRDAFVAAGVPFELTEMPGHDHNYYARSDDINKRVWAFLNAKVLDADPEFDHYEFR